MTPDGERNAAARRSRDSWYRERADRVIPGRSQTFSKGPLSFVESAPAFLRRGKGARVEDLDGNQYIDYILGLGPVILGHADETVNRAVSEQIADGVAFSLPHPIEAEVAEMLCELIPCAEMVRFGKNGSDATSGAVRLARAITGRDKVIRCGYHGWQDWYIGSTSRYHGVPDAVRALTLVAPYNQLDAAAELFAQNRDDIACLILEPVTFDLPRPGYLEGLRDLCSRHGALLIFDEVVTGFRLHLGGAQAVFGVVPDLACFGKAMANGFPLSAVVGRADYMRSFEEVFFSFTFGGETASLAAARATIDVLRKENGLQRIADAGAHLQQGTRACISEAGLDGVLDCAGLPAWTTLRCLTGTSEYSLLLRSIFQQECVQRDILTHGNHMLSVAHDNDIISETLLAYKEIFPVLAEAVHSGVPERWLSGPPMRAVLRQS